MPRTSRARLTTALAALAALALLVLVDAAPARAKMSSKEWKEAQAEFTQLFGNPGKAPEKIALLKRLTDEASGKAYRLVSDALYKEVEIFAHLQKEVATLSAEHGDLSQRGMKGYTPADEERVKEVQRQLKFVEGRIKEERVVIEAVVANVSEGPEVLRKTILQRAKSGGDWPYRAAAVRVAAKTIGEKNSWAFLRKSIAADPDPRVRLSALDALVEVPERWEDLVIGRLADTQWVVVLRAADIAAQRELHRAVPHLINALGKASPRVAQGIGAALCTLTKENFEPFLDVWTRWWDDHKEDFEKDIAVKKGRAPEFARVHFYGVEIKSDRVLFIIDVSGSMKLKTKNENPKEKWKPPPTVTGKNKPPPPPPPPEEILSGPKIEVAKHELKKAIEKLPKGYKFNIVCFNQAATHWKKGMVKASEKNKESAYKWIGVLKPHGSTYIDGALRLGFRIAGLLNYDKRYPEITLDTIVLLSDGAPTDNSFPVSKLMAPEEILDHVREWNVGKKVIIHCIGVDMVGGIEFLQKLAAENGGTYVDR